MITALIHGNELCGAWAIKGLIEAGVPLRAAGEVLHDGKDFISFELLLAPLSRSGEAIDTLFLLSQFDMPSLAD